jgi:2'-5' RNA ligase
VTTIGVAIAVPEPWASRLQDYRESLGDATAATIPTHITLIPPIDVDEALLPVIEQHLTEASESAHAFRIHMRGTGTFRPVSPVVFVGVVEGISECEFLVEHFWLYVHDASNGWTPTRDFKLTAAAEA